MSNNNSLNIDKNIMEIIDNELFWDTIKCLNVVREERHKKGLKKLSDKITEGHIKTLRNLLYYLYDDHQEDENEDDNDIMNCCECNRPIKTNNFIRVGFNFLDNLKYKHNDCDNPLWEDDSDN